MNLQIKLEHEGKEYFAKHWDASTSDGDDITFEPPLLCGDGRLLTGLQFEIKRAPKVNSKLVKCGSHGELPGYVACKHVLEGKACEHIPIPEDGFGQLACLQCCWNQPHPEDLLLLCSKCAEK